MASKNRAREFFPGYHYHIYTRGVNRRHIFKDAQDYNMFLRYLKLYLLPTEILKKLAANDIRIAKFIRMNLSDDVDLICFALMPNHFHLLIRLKQPKGVENLMHRVLTAYAMYFNQKYNRVGHLFEGKYKAATVLTDEYLLYLTRYIHRNPLKYRRASPDFTSLPYYLGDKKSSWLKPEEILEYFNSTNKILSYQSFVEDKNELELGHLTLE